MRSVDVVVETELVRTPRVKQFCGMFDVPAQEKLTHRWQGELPIDERDWNVGLIVGPSGSGKSTIRRHLFGEQPALEWSAGSVVDDFASTWLADEIVAACSAVGFNTIPSWLKPHSVLSTGEKFRVELARHLLEDGDLIVVDEFTSVVDRQVAQIGSHAAQKYARKKGKKFVAVTCHYDVLDWLQPDWVFEPATMTFKWRSVQRRPPLQIEIARVHYESWKLFAPFHYLTAELLRSAACYVLFVEGVPASFAGVIHRPHPTVDDVKGVSRLVTLPDYQGMGFGSMLDDTLGAAFKALGYRLHLYPAHPARVRTLDRSPKWLLKKKPGVFSPALGRTSSMRNSALMPTKRWSMGSRPCAVFEYCGVAMPDRDQAEALISGSKKAPLSGSEASVEAYADQQYVTR
jgi:GNAT superfamily N-acetyltransferase